MPTTECAYVICLTIFHKRTYLTHRVVCCSTSNCEQYKTMPFIRHSVCWMQQSGGKKKVRVTEWSGGRLSLKVSYLSKEVPPDSSRSEWRPGVTLNSSLIEWLFTGQREMPAPLQCGRGESGGSSAFVWPVPLKVSEHAAIVSGLTSQPLSDSPLACFVSSSVTISFIQVRAGSWLWTPSCLVCLTQPEIFIFRPKI